ncbi:MAG: hypothetical protein ACYTEQ_11705 [Planctomycetota bacterium]|jgi:hypothetical protein
MTEITFVKTRHHYDSYIDFWRLVELSGFPTIYTDEVDVSKPGVFIVSPMNGEWRPHIGAQKDKPRNAHLILWNLERPSGAGSVGQYAEDCRALLDGYKRGDNDNWVFADEGRYLDEIWVSDRRLAQETNHATRFVILGSDEGLGQSPEEKIYDFCHISYENNRRQTIFKNFPRETIGPNCWPPERDKVLQQSKFGLALHQDNFPFQEPLRMAIFAAYKLPVICEGLYDAFPWSPEFCVLTGYNQMVQTIKAAIVADYAPYQAMANRAWQLMCKKHRFRDMVIQAVEQSVGVWGSWR